MQLNWNNVDDIAIELYEGDPDYNPLQIRFTDLIERILSLPGFIGEVGIWGCPGNKFR